MSTGIWLWWLVLGLAVWATHWGSERLARPLQKLRRQWGLSGAAGGSLVALATASPEVGTNTMSAIQGVADIGIGNLLGSNIVSVPAIVTVAYLASRGRPIQDRNNQTLPGNWLPVEKEANTVQAIPYVAIVALVALLTLPTPWRGLQPIDGWIMLAAYLLYVTHSLLRGRKRAEPVSWTGIESALAIAGVAILIAGAYFTVRATEHIVDDLGISHIIGGLFITATMSIVPEVIATWNIARSGQVTSAATTVIADNTVTITLGFFPLALVTTTINDFQLYWVNLLFVALLGIAYAVFVGNNSHRRGFEPWEVFSLGIVYLVYLLVMIFGVLQ